jgi:hypothetical protein
MLKTNCNFLAVEIVEVAGPHVDRTDESHLLRVVDPIEIDKPF